jgi:hypothetical protein
MLWKPANDDNSSNPLKFVRFDPVVGLRDQSGDELEDKAAKEAEWLDNVFKDLNSCDR